MLAVLSYILLFQVVSLYPVLGRTKENPDDCEYPRLGYTLH
jgi:hypothetical protein